MERIQQSRRNGFATMVVGVWSLTAVLLVTLLASPTTALSLNRDTPTPTTNSSSSGVTKGGRCPDAKMDQRLCSEGGDQCTHDAQCSGESLCCSTGCGRVCVIPVFTACEQVRSFAERRARSLEPEDAASVPLPDCDPETGKFQEVQCSAAKGGCFCVDSQGFELPGTRAATREQVNCSRRNPKCEGPTCRMLCPHGFALDSDGCETCECLNFCSKVKCPSGEECEVVEPPCSTSPCPPVPSCKQPRSLDSLCPFGAPLTIPELGSPFLCGSGPSGPPCPAAFQCNVGAGNDYGVCCAANKNFDKPGTCPVVGVTLDNKDDQEEADKACPAGCRHDLDCPDFDKCCFTQGCGKQCSKPANTTACLQQKHIAELLSGRELEGKGYIPQCDESGTFLPKQCSRNGKVCWCVGPDGKNFAQSLGSAESVNCSTLSTTTSRHRAGAPRSDDSSYVTSACDPIICPPNLSCEYGFKTDRNSCPTCDCMESPCAHLRCPSGSGCVLVKSERGGEALEPTCLSDSLFVNPCPLGSPLTYAQSAQVVACSQSAPTCPSSHICVLVAPNKAGLCCPNSPRLEPTKPGMCPFLAPTLCSGSTTSTANNSLELVQSHKKCGSDSDCNTSMKCCAAGDCTVCADPLLHQDIPHTKSNTPSMCQYLRDVDTHTPLLGKFRMAKSKPQCKENGEFSEIQCDQDHCACVDEHGAEIPGTMMDKLSHNLTTKACLAARHNPKCLEMNCRLECDYGYERVDTCKICECKNPCLSKHNCGEDDQCEMVDIDCVEDHCPPLPFCVPKVLAALANGEALSPGGGNAVVSPCPGGRAPFRSSDSNDSALSCSPRARMLQCPDGQCPSSHICVLVAPKKLGKNYKDDDSSRPDDYFCAEVALDSGICCPILEDGLQDDDEEDDSYLLPVENRASSSSDGSHHNNLLELLFGESAHAMSHQHAKPGQCPYLLPFHPVDGCGESECETDSHCGGGSKKCCLNSCGGTQCVEPLLLTACQHQREILEHKARESGMPTRRVFIPECDSNGQYVRIQSFSGLNWCVDSAGEEIQGTRVKSPNLPNCQKPSQCPQKRCSLQCEFGLNLDSAGCPLCDCKPSPCDQVVCSSGEECRMVQLNCISEPCPPAPLCLPRLDNPCPFGSPLAFEESGEWVSCRSGGRGCPSSHKCNISPFGEYAVCCPKPKEVCFEPVDEGGCKSPSAAQRMTTTTRWFFNTSSNECQPFPFFGCGGNNNQFNSKAECLSVCPALSHCERMRGKNAELVGKYGHMSYIPKCDSRSGDWEPVQCLEEVGMCWCVDKKKGEPLKGSMTSGVPNCQPRRGRAMKSTPESSFPPQNQMVCEAGVTVHKCPKSTCSSKICFAYPDALCMVNPCGGCTPKWVSPSTGQELDCSSGLGSCHREMNLVMNSQAWINQGYSFGMAVPPPPSQEDEEDAMMMMMNPFGSLSELLHRGDGGSGMATEGNRLEASRSMRTGPIFTASLGNGMMGIMSSSVTFVGDSSSSEEDGGHTQTIKKTKNPMVRAPHSSPVKSIADILADLMTSGSSHGTVPGYLSDDLVDLMPSSSSAPRGRPSKGREEDEEEFAFLRRSRVRRDLEEQEFEDSLAMESSSHGFSSEENGPMSSRREILVSILPHPSNSISATNGLRGGTCPPPSPFALLALLSGSCGDECDADQDCPTGLKCCLGGCGLRCIPITSNERSPLPSLVNPVYEAVEVEPPSMVVSLPECGQKNGTYSPVQSQGELSWCVSPDGTPVPETLTRGKVICSTNGTLLQRWMKGPVCPDPHQTPTVCKDTCLHASCSLHPDAVCVMDVCDSCSPSFYKPSGEKVRCEPACAQPAFDPGLCRASIPRFSFNSTSATCEPFIYGGCGGNSNNFVTLEDCSSQCVGGGGGGNDICNLPLKPGPCRASMLRFHFNPTTQSCTPFDYGGCGGNANNFMSREQCESRCPDVVICPKFEQIEQELETGVLKTCSRTEACRNVTCPGHDLDDFLCTVDPCSCTASLTDFHGNKVNCEDLLSPTMMKTASSGDDADVIEIAPSESFFTGQFLKLRPGISLPTHTRCELIQMREPSGTGPHCDSVTGKFTPRQCPPSDSDFPCFCVDEAGKLMEGVDATTSCETTLIAQINVSLSLPGGEDVPPVQLGVELQQLLQVLGAELGEKKVEVEVLPDRTQLNFRLVGTNGVDVSFWLESLIIANAIGVEDAKGVFHPADFATSTFTHERLVNQAAAQQPELVVEVSTSTTSTSTTTTEEPDSANEIDDDVDVIAAQRLLESEDNTVGIMLTLVAALTACLILLGLFLAAGGNKKRVGSEGGGVLWHKKAFGGLGAFSSGLYEVEEREKRKMKGTTTTTLSWRDAVTIPTFKVTPTTKSSKT